MNKFVIEFEVTDRYTFSVTKSIPIKYESKEKLEYDMLEKMIAAKENNQDEFEIAGHFLYCCCPNDFEFTYYIYTLDEWFNANNISYNR